MITDLIQELSAKSAKRVRAKISGTPENPYSAF